MAQRDARGSGRVYGAQIHRYTRPQKGTNLKHNARTRGGWSTAATEEELENPLVNEDIRCRLYSQLEYDPEATGRPLIK